MLVKRYVYIRNNNTNTNTNLQINAIITDILHLD